MLRLGQRETRDYYGDDTRLPTEVGEKEGQFLPPDPTVGTDGPPPERRDDEHRDEGPKTTKEKGPSL